MVGWFGPLYSRLRRQQVLDNFLRGRIYEHVRTNPGVSLGKVHVAVGAGMSTVCYHLQRLEAEEFVHSVRRGWYRHYYSTDAPHRQSLSDSRALQEEILMQVGDHPGMGQRALARALGRSSSTIHHEVHRLEGVGMLQIVRTGTTTRLYLSPLRGEGFPQTDAEE